MTVLHRLTLVEVLVRHLCAASLERHVRPISCWKSPIRRWKQMMGASNHTSADEAALVPRSAPLKLSSHCIAAAGLVLHAVALVALQVRAGSGYLGNLSTCFTSSELVSPAVSQSLLQPFPWQLQNVKTWNGEILRLSPFRLIAWLPAVCMSHLYRSSFSRAVHPLVTTVLSSPIRTAKVLDCITIESLRCLCNPLWSIVNLLQWNSLLPLGVDKSQARPYWKASRYMHRAHPQHYHTCSTVKKKS